MISFDYSIDVTTEAKMANHFCWKIGFMDMMQQAQVPVAEIVGQLEKQGTGNETGAGTGTGNGNGNGNRKLNA